MVYPVEGDSAVCEIYLDDDLWADASLENIDLSATGLDRVANAAVLLRVFHPEPRQSSAQPDALPLERVVAALIEARDRLVANETGRLPTSEDTT